MSNLVETEKRIHRLISLAYLLFLLVFATWYNINFERSPLETDIESVNRGLRIEVLKPWDNFLDSTTSCFHSYFFGYSKGGVVTPTELEQYIQHYEAENTEPMGYVKMGMQRPWPVEEMKRLRDSEQHWHDCAFWARQDTLVSFLFSLDLYLSRYRIERMRAYLDNALDDFWATTDSINASLDSILWSLGVFVDSLKKPMEYAVRVGWNPIFGAPILGRTLWGRPLNFDAYGTYDLNGLLCRLQRLNHISWFKKELLKHRDVLLHVKQDLNRMVFPDSSSDIIPFSERESDIHFFDLGAILESDLLALSDLPDSIQLPKLCDLSYSELARRTVDDALLKVQFPEYVQVLERFKVDKPMALKSLRNILITQRGGAIHRIHALGAEISSRSILYILPTIALVMNLLIIVFTNHLSNLLKVDVDRLWEGAEVIALKLEVLKAPLLFTIRPTWLRPIILSIPSLGIVCLLVDNLLSTESRGIPINPWFVIPLVILLLITAFFVVRRVILLERYGPIEDDTFSLSCDLE